MDFETIRLLIDKYGYLALFLGAFFNGLHAMLLGGFLTALGYLKLAPTFLALVMGDFLSDIAWYFLAYFGGSRVIDFTLRFHPDIPRHIERAKDLLERHAGKMILMAKLTFGVGIATMLAAGLSRMRLPKFLFFDFAGNAALTAGFLVLGYFFGESYEAIGEYFRVLKIFFLVVIIIGIFAFDIWKKKKTEKSGN